MAEEDGLRTRLGGGTGSGFITEKIAVEERAFDRVGLRFDATITPDVEVRVFAADEDRWSEWTPATMTYQEGIAHNAHADVAGDGTHIQLRFRGVDRDDLSFLVVEAFEYRPEPVGEPIDMQGAQDPEFAQREQALAANNGVDVTRAQWGASPTNCSVGHGPYRVTVHHTVTPTNDSVSVTQRVQQIQNFHMNTQGWCDIGYHFLVGQDGQVYAGRHEGLRGTHVGGNNTGNLGVSFIGTYTSVAPSGGMFDAGGRILAAISGYYGIGLDRGNIRGHREYGGTACPGDVLFGQLDHLLGVAQGSSGGSPGGETDAQGCTTTEAENCGAFGCGCVNGECAGGFCEGSGCTEQQESNCGAFGCGCVDGECAGGFCPGSGCTAKQETDCGGFGCGCVDGECSGGFCEGSGCTAKQQTDCGNFGCSCVDGACAGGFCEGSGCTALQTINCGEVGCDCVDGSCAGGFCDGTGCTAKQENDCGGVGCDCTSGECTGGFCEESSCDDGLMECGDGSCVDEQGCCNDNDCSDGEVCVEESCETPGELHASMELSPMDPVYPNVPEPQAAGTAVTASDTSYGDIEVRQWSFEDGDPESSDEDDTVVRFQSQGTKEVRLNVCTDGGDLCDEAVMTIDVLDPAPTLGEVQASPESTPPCLPIEFRADGVGGYPIPDLTLEIIEESSGDVVASGAEVASGLWDTTGVEPGTYFARLTATNESGEVHADSVAVEVVAPGDGDDSECEDGESEIEPDTGGEVVPDAGPDAPDDGDDVGVDGSDDIGPGPASGGDDVGDVHGDDVGVEGSMGEEEQTEDESLPSESCGGCSVGGNQTGSAPLLLFLLALAVVTTRRRGHSSRSESLA